MFKTLKDFEVKGKRVLVRCDFNVPLSEEGEILDDFRIRQILPTIKYLMENGAKIILMSHLGRPNGRAVEELRLTPIQNRLMEYLDISITKAADCIGGEIEKWTRQMQPGEIMLLENLRFHKEEKENDDNFARELAKLGDLYINDAFGVSHRKQASVVGVPKYLPAAAGFLLEKEINVLTNLIKNPEKPLIAIIGGKKVETKLKLIEEISNIADWILIGDLLNAEIEEKNIFFKNVQKIVRPKESGRPKDLASETIKLFKEKIRTAKTVFWNGPLGLIEEEQYQKGTKEIIDAIIESGAFFVLGGGETAEFVHKKGLTEKVNHISTGGGAMLTLLSSKELPGIEALK